jgi:hypothetical protein
MTKQWDGTEERRKPTKDGREGRRPTDFHCAQHDILWEHHEDDKNKFRELSCGKIKEVKSNLAIEVDRLEKVDAAISTKIEEMNKIVVGKFWFRVVIGAMFAALIYIAGQNRLSNNDQIDALKDISRNQKEISAVINNIENKQIEMVGQMAIFKLNIDELTRRQDVLRDINIKQRQNDGRDGRDGNMGRDGRDAK